MKLTTEEQQVLLDALNNYYHYTDSKLQSNSLGDIERTNYLSLKAKTHQLLQRYSNRESVLDRQEKIQYWASTLSYKSMSNNKLVEEVNWLLDKLGD